MSALGGVLAVAMWDWEDRLKEEEVSGEDGDDDHAPLTDLIETVPPEEEGQA